MFPIGLCVIVDTPATPSQQPITLDNPPADFDD